MYASYIVKRTQIYLSEEQGRYLARRSEETGRTVSELIRAAIDDTYLKHPMDKAERLRIVRATAGAWKDFPYTGAEWVDRIRGRGRLARLHGIER
ncbi:MAG: ribbon-helix-helix protein, CopG family [Chloroflexi bacterium]|nr:ribbon-helix-helix protein, CopG family [Chloroflexota bacterium]